MKQEKITKVLQDIGMNVFVNWLEICSHNFTQGRSNQEAIQKIQSKYGIEYTDKSYNSRVSKIKSIINTSLERESLLQIINSTHIKVTNNTKEKAKTLLNKYARTWLISLGYQSDNFDIDSKEGVISIGWSEIGDLKNFDNKEAFGEAIKNKCRSTSNNPTNDRLACFEFANKMNIGDLVFITKGYHSIIGYGYITGEYQYQQERNLYPNTREFFWKNKELHRLTSKRNPHKTLTEITDFSHIQRLKSLCKINPTIYSNISEEENQYDICVTEGEKLEFKGTYIYSRNSKVAKEAKERDNYTCQICGFYWKNKIVHSHHLDPLADGKRATLLEDLLTLCPTCHSIAHLLLKNEDGCKYKVRDTLKNKIKSIINEIESENL